MAWTYEQLFDSLSDGDLNGQDSFTADTTVDVQTTTKYRGARGVLISGAGVASRSITSVSSGIVYFAMMWHTSNAGNDGLYVQIRTAVSYASVIKFVVNGGNVELQYYSNGSYYTIQTTSADTWYVIGIDYDGANNRYKYIVNNGTWSGYVTTGTSTNTSSDLFRFGQDSGWECYLDEVTPTNPNSTLTSVSTDGIKVGESLSIFRALTTTITDGIKIGEVISNIKIWGLSVVEGIKLGEVVSAVLDGIARWTNRTKPSTTFTNRTKPSTSFTDRTKPTTTWTKVDRG